MDSGETAEQLDITSFNAVNIRFNLEIRVIVVKYFWIWTYKNFLSIGRCKDKRITPHLKDFAKSCIQPVRQIPFHLRKKINAVIDKIIKEEVIEKYNGPTEWLSNPVIVPKDDIQCKSQLIIEMSIKHY